MWSRSEKWCPGLHRSGIICPFFFKTNKHWETNSGNKACIRSGTAYAAFFSPAADGVKRLTAKGPFFCFPFVVPVESIILPRWGNYWLIYRVDLFLTSLSLFLFFLCAISRQLKVKRHAPSNSSTPRCLSPVHRFLCLQSPVSPSACALYSKRWSTPGILSFVFLSWRVSPPADEWRR